MARAHRMTAVEEGLAIVGAVAIGLWVYHRYHGGGRKGA
jgi:hypothetical protein